MKAKFESNFGYGQKIGKYLTAAAVVLIVSAFLLKNQGSIIQSVLLIAAAAAMVSAVVVIYKFCRCPYCGKHIFFGVMNVKVCPACRRNLSNGKKTKKYER